ncbi:MAG: hypothetical protein U1E63_12215 [Burkholderiales bacterium]
MLSASRKVDSREEALAAAHEAVEIFRRLARDRAEVFLPYLATSLSVTSDVLAALERHPEAMQTAGEALGILAPFVERFPGRHGDLARYIGACILRHSEAAGMASDIALLERVARALDRR